MPLEAVAVRDDGSCLLLTIGCPFQRQSARLKDRRAKRGMTLLSTAGTLISKVFLSVVGQGCVLPAGLNEVPSASVCRLLGCGFSKVGCLSHRLVGIEFPSLSLRSSHAFGQLFHRRLL